MSKRGEKDEINTFLETITNLEAFDLKLKEDNSKTYMLSKNQTQNQNNP